MFAFSQHKRRRLPPREGRLGPGYRDMKTLADSLGLTFASPEAPALPPPTTFEDDLTGQQFALAVLESREFRQYIIDGLTARDLPPAVICRLIDHGWGKPKETIDHRVTVTRVTRQIVDVVPDAPEESIH